MHTQDRPLVIEHHLEVRLFPDASRIEVRDRIRQPANLKQIDFLLHRDLNPRVIAGAARLESLGLRGHLEAFRLQLDQPSQESDLAGNEHWITLSYGGEIRHDMAEIREGMGRSRESSIGTISPEGVFLSAATAWYPRVPDSLQRFSLSVALPPDWLAVSQGAGPVIEPMHGDAGSASGDSAPAAVRITWREDQPQDAIYLNAARFELYRRDGPIAEAQVYLRADQASPELAERYLDATQTYLARYEALLGDYPYDKFALVENFWETGYGMPSFTLLGPRVIRLPFILHSSYPHEILHNWWGNAVYIDYESGNWAEGLTAYLADHLNKALEGRGADYRRDQLKGYGDYVQDGEDFPLRAFRGRHGNASQAIGYGKMLMVTHMLRNLLGDQVFIEGLRQFYADNQFRTAGFDELQSAFEQVSGQDLDGFFRAWVDRAGAPTLTLSDVQAAVIDAIETSTPGHEDPRYRVSARLTQKGPGTPFPLPVPILIQDQLGGWHQELLLLDKPVTEFSIDLPAPPRVLAIDPRFEVFRSLMPGESPATLSQVFGAEQGLILLPSAAPEPLLEGYRALAETWQRGSPGWEIRSDDSLDELPRDRALWLLGWENSFLSALSETDASIALDPADRTASIAGQPVSDASLVLVTARQQRMLGSVSDHSKPMADSREHNQDAQQSDDSQRHGNPQPIGWIGTSELAALPGLARKLPHYGKYSYLSFSGPEASNQIKGQWPASDSPLTHWFSNERGALNAPERPTLLEALQTQTGP